LLIVKKLSATFVHSVHCYNGRSTDTSPQLSRPTTSLELDLKSCTSDKQLQMSLFVGTIVYAVWSVSATSTDLGRVVGRHVCVREAQSLTSSERSCRALLNSSERARNNAASGLLMYTRFSMGQRMRRCGYDCMLNGHHRPPGALVERSIYTPYEESRSATRVCGHTLFGALVRLATGYRE
jgi:hypothetical protein